MTRSGRSLLRLGGILPLLACAAVAVAAPAVAAGPAPDPPPQQTNSPKPEPVPGARTPTPPPPASQAPPPPPAPVVTRSTPPAPFATPPPAAVTPPPPAAVVRRSARPQAPKRAVKKAKTGGRTTKPAVKRPIRAISAEAAGSPDSLLLIGGLALFVLVLADTVFLTLSRRNLRPG